MPEGDGDFLTEYVKRLLDTNEGKDEGKGRVSAAFSPGVGTISIPAPPPNLTLPPAGQAVPMGMGIVVSAGAALATLVVDMKLEQLKRSAVEKELAVLAAEIIQTCTELQPQPAPQKKALGLRTRRKPKLPKHRHKVYARTRARHRSASQTDS